MTIFKSRFFRHLSEIYNIHIGGFCSIGHHVKIVTGNQPLENWITTHPAFFSTAKQAGFSFLGKNIFAENSDSNNNSPWSVQIGNDVWIRDCSIIREGVTIGDGAVIGMGSAVVKDVLPYEIVAANPAKLIRKRFNDTTIKELLEIDLWSKSIQWLQKNYKEFNTLDNIMAKIEREHTINQ